MISNRYACKICCSFAGIKLVSALYRLEEKKSPGAHVFHGTAKQVISSGRNNETSAKFTKKLNCTETLSFFNILLGAGLFCTVTVLGNSSLFCVGRSKCIEDWLIF